MLAGIRDILIITTPKDHDHFVELLKDGSQWGISIKYAIQTKPSGIAEAFIIAEKFINNEPSCLILGDNILYGAGNIKFLQEQAKSRDGASVFCLSVKDPHRYGVVSITAEGKAMSIEEKPENPKSNFAVIGLYFYDNNVVDIAKSIAPSSRGELEITTVNQIYLQRNKLTVNQLGRGAAWFDAGTHESLVEASYFMNIIERQQGLKIGCCEEIAYSMGYIDEKQLERLIFQIKNTSYGQYLKTVLKTNFQEKEGAETLYENV
ncbi:MAG: Glucose-1-phosphate thymidylyltransferase 2 [Chlamydiae bacterium]|nr:Glucose-1-phosphate thymidylyltransferase 2 [Chlamydiota bacterium]